MNRKGNLAAAVGLLIVLTGGIVFAILSRNSLLGENWEFPVPPPSAPEEQAVEEQAVILLDGDRVSVSGAGASVSEEVLTIHRGGAYSISGLWEKGRIVVDAGDKDTVILSLRGVKISHPSEAVIQVENAGHTRLVLEGDTLNRLQSGEERALPAAGEGDASGAAVYAKGDLSITGSGVLQVLGYLNNGIHTARRLTVESGELNVVAANNALKGKESVTVSGGSLSLLAGGDGIQSDGTEKEDWGAVSISDGNFVIQSGGDGIQAETRLEITGGVFAITAGGEGIAPLISSGEAGRDREGLPSAKGLKSGGEIRISEGSLGIDSLEDALHAGDDLRILGGSFTINTADKGVHTGSQLIVGGGALRIARSYEGLEGGQVAINGGELSIVSTEDGINALGGPSGNGAGKLPALRITGGEVTVNAGGDGLDSNGDLFIEGGLVILDGPEGEKDRAIDFGKENGGVCKISGGILLALDGSASMADLDPCFSQRFLRRSFPSPIPAGSAVRILDGAGQPLLEYTSSKPVSSVAFSSPELVFWESYQVTAGDQTAVVETVAPASSGRWFPWRLPWE